jgi:hypothetical protein
MHFFSIKQITSSIVERYEYEYSLKDFIIKLLLINKFFPQRCIKPNENSFSNQFVSTVVFKQIRDSGLVEFSRVRKFNYSIKIEFSNLLNR